MDLSFNEQYLITALRVYDRFLHQNGYMGPSIAYNERDGDSITYTGYKKANKYFKIHIWYGLSELYITITKPMKFLSGLKWLCLAIIEAFLPPKYKIKLAPIPVGLQLNLTNEIKKIVNTEEVKNTLTEQNCEQIMLSYKNILEKDFLPVIRGEKWLK